MGGITEPNKRQIYASLIFATGPLLSDYGAKKLEKDGWEYELTFEYKDDEDLENQIDDLASEMHFEADMRNGFIESSFSEIGTDRSW